MSDTLNLPKVVSRHAKRLGRGYGSGKGGHTSSRGQKGQKARAGLGIMFEGLKVRKSLLHRLPFHRGKSKFHSGVKPLPIDVLLLNSFNAGETVNEKSLVEKGVVTAQEFDKYGVKILGKGDLSKKLVVNVPTSRSARISIEKAGGSVEV